MTPEEFATRHPKLYHMAEPGSWLSILARGLLSTSALLDLYEVTGERRRAIESTHRPKSMPISHASHGTAWVRDQKPMSEAKLQQSLVDMTPREWYETLNRHVFFWPTEKRLGTLLEARAYRARAHTVLTVDTAALLRRYLPHTRLSPINSGSTLFTAVARGSDTFRSLSEYPDDWWRRGRLAEVAVEYAIPDVRELVLRVEVWQGPTVPRTVLDVRSTSDSDPQPLGMEEAT